MNIILKNAILWMLRLYQWLVSPLFPPACRFYPSCSHYGRDAFSYYGFLRAVVLTLRRLARCHPWHPGGYDPLP